MSSPFDSIDLVKPKNSLFSEHGFQFSMTQGAQGAEKVVSRRNGIANEIEAIIMRFQTETSSAGHILPQILMTLRKEDGTFDVKAIGILGKVLQHLAGQLKEFETLEAKAQFVNYALANPDTVAELFCDFDTTVDSFTDRFFTQEAQNNTSPSESVDNLFSE